VSAAAFDEAAARSFVERWVAAQNAHDFAAYSSLYAQHFAGTKRVGTYSKRFERAAWLADRRPMFVDGVVVRASDLELSGSPGAVRAVFTQDFVAPGFHDTGKKELFLLAQPSGFAISREEMLASNLADAPPAADNAVLAVHRDGVVLQRGIPSAGLGAPRLLPRSKNDTFDVAAPIPESAVNVVTRAWLGRTVTVYAKDGKACESTVQRLEVRVKSEPHFGMRQAWDGEGGAPKSPPSEIAVQIWKTARDDERFVVGVLAKECPGVWAVTRPSAFVVAQAPAPQARAAAVAAFKRLPAYRELQVRFARDNPGSAPTTPWETVDGDLQVVEVRSAPDSSLMIVAARGGVSCGGFMGNLSAIWSVRGAEPAFQFTARGVFKDANAPLVVHGAIDQNSDGSLELLAGPDDFGDQISVLRGAADGYARKVLLSTALWDCGC